MIHVNISQISTIRGLPSLLWEHDDHVIIETVVESAKRVQYQVAIDPKDPANSKSAFQAAWQKQCSH